MNSVLPSSSAARPARSAAARRRPRTRRVPAITAAGTAMPSAEVDQHDQEREHAPAPGQVGLARGPGPPEKAMRTHDEPEHEEGPEDEEHLHRGRHSTGRGRGRPAAERWARPSSLGGGAPGALPAAVGGEHVAQGGEARRRRRRAAGSRPSGAARGAGRRPRPPSRMASRTSSSDASASPPARLASWAKTPAALPRAPGSADGVGRARPDPPAGGSAGTAGAPWAIRLPPWRSTSRWQCGQ